MDCTAITPFTLCNARHDLRAGAPMPHDSCETSSMRCRVILREILIGFVSSIRVAHDMSCGGAQRVFSQREATNERYSDCELADERHHTTGDFMTADTE